MPAEAESHVRCLAVYAVTSLFPKLLPRLSWSTGSLGTTRRRFGACRLILTSSSGIFIRFHFPLDTSAVFSVILREYRTTGQEPAKGIPVAWEVDTEPGRQGRIHRPCSLPISFEVDGMEIITNAPKLAPNMLLLLAPVECSDIR